LDWLPVVDSINKNVGIFYNFLDFTGGLSGNRVFNSEGPNTCGTHQTSNMRRTSGQPSLILYLFHFHGFIPGDLHSVTGDVTIPHPEESGHDHSLSELSKMINGLNVVCLSSGHPGGEVTAEGERTQADKNKSRTANPGITIFLNNMSLPLGGRESGIKKSPGRRFPALPTGLRNIKYYNILSKHCQGIFGL
jgi:hypothetical protein